MNQTEAQEDLEIAKYKERVKQYQQKVALYQQTYPERNMSQLKKRMLTYTMAGTAGKKIFVVQQDYTRCLKNLSI
ncbi:MAG: hypothetical protein ACLRWM_03050 [Streptococcus sp.]